MIRLSFKLFKPTGKTIDRKALVKFRSSNHKPMIETGRYDQTPRDKDYPHFAISIKLKMKFTFPAIAHNF